MLKTSIKSVLAELKEKEKKQDKAFYLSRETVRQCAKAISLIHSKKYEEAQKLIKRIKKAVNSLLPLYSEFSNVTNIAFQEYVEASALLSILEHKKIPSSTHLKSPSVPYLLGLADVVGELHRELQIALKENDKKSAHFFYSMMNEIYENLSTVKFASSLVGNLRQKVDVDRRQLEAARSELLRR